MSSYYVDATGGLDSNDGLTTTTAWQTIAKAMTQSYLAGDNLYFKRGETFTIAAVPSFPSSGSLGALQSISGWNTPSSWTNEGNNIWSMTLSEYPFEIWLSGVQYEEALEIYNINSTNRWSWRPTDYTANTFKLRVYSVGNPASAYTNIQYRDTSGHITIGAYGSGAAPIIDGSRQVVSGSATAGNWTDNGSNIWYMTLSVDPDRLWLNDVEQPSADQLVAGPGGSYPMSSTYTWYWDNAANRLYVYSLGNPATLGTTVKGNGGYAQAFAVSAKSYLHFNGIEIRGGRTATFVQTQGTYNIYENMTFGYGGYGMQFVSTTFSNRCIIRNNYFDSQMRFVGIGYDDMSGVADAIHMRDGMKYAKIYRNQLKNYIHTAMLFQAVTSGCDGDQYNSFFSNEVDCSDTFDGRPYSFRGLEGKSQYNEIYYNKFHHTKAGSKLDGNNNHCHHNFYYVGRQQWYATGTLDSAVFVFFISTGATEVSHDNLLENEVFYDNSGPAIRMYQQSSPSATKYGHIIRNNIIVNCGNNSVGPNTKNIGLLVDTGSNVGANTYQNNIIYLSTSDLTCQYSSANYTVAGFNSKDGNAGNVISGNIAKDALMTNPDGQDFTPRIGSPCIDGGVTGNPGYDYSGNYFPVNGYDIGGYELQANNLLLRTEPPPSRVQVRTLSEGQYVRSPRKRSVILQLQRQEGGRGFFKDTSQTNKYLYIPGDAWAEPATI